MDGPDVVGMLIAHYRAERDAFFDSLTACSHGHDKPKHCTRCWENVYVNSDLNDLSRAKRELEDAMTKLDKEIGMDPLLAVSVKLRKLADTVAGLYSDRSAK